MKEKIRLDELNIQYKKLSEKIRRLRKKHAYHADEAVRFQLENEIEEAESERDELEKQIEEAENSNYHSIKTSSISREIVLTIYGELVLAKSERELRQLYYKALRLFRKYLPNEEFNILIDDIEEQIEKSSYPDTKRHFSFEFHNIKHLLPIAEQSYLFLFRRTYMCFLFLGLNEFDANEITSKIMYEVWCKSLRPPTIWEFLLLTYKINKINIINICYKEYKNFLRDQERFLSSKCYSEYCHNFTLSEEKILEFERYEVVNNALKSLTIKERQLFYYQFIEKLNTQEISIKIGVHPSTIYRRKRKLLNKIKIIVKNMDIHKEDIETFLHRASLESCFEDFNSRINVN